MAYKAFSNQNIQLFIRSKIVILNVEVFLSIFAMICAMGTGLYYWICKIQRNWQIGNLLYYAQMLKSFQRQGARTPLQARAPALTMCPFPPFVFPSSSDLAPALHPDTDPNCGTGLGISGLEWIRLGGGLRSSSALVFVFIRFRAFYILIRIICHFTLYFLPRCMECSRGIAMGILSVCLSVHLSVCPSNAWIVTKRKKAVFRFLYHTKEHLS